MRIPSGALVIEGGVRIPAEEIKVSFSRSGGPGGQHVNKVETRVDVTFDLANSSSLTPGQKTRAIAALGPRLFADGTLRVVSSRERSQGKNREVALARLAALLRWGLRKPRTRIPTRKTAGSDLRRRTQKKIVGERKKGRNKGRVADLD